MKTTIFKTRCNAGPRGTSSSISSAGLARRGVRTHVPACRKNISLTRRSAFVDGSSSSSSSPSKEVSNLVSQCVKAKADMVWFEQFAGRSAMLGFLNALLYEGATGDGIFQSDPLAGASGDLFLYFARASAGAALLLSVIYARTTLKGNLLRDVKESYATFLSSSGATSNPLEKMVDEVLNGKRTFVGVTIPVEASEDNTTNY